MINLEKEIHKNVNSAKKDNILIYNNDTCAVEIKQ